VEEAKMADRSGAPDQTDKIAALVAQLASKDGMQREEAREQLAGIGRPAVRPLIAALEDRRETVRWEAAKTLGMIGNRRAAPHLVKTLEDEEFDVRWVAAEALVAIGRASLPPLLLALVARSSSVPLREGAHHVLRRMRLESEHDAALIDPVLSALEQPYDPQDAVLVAAEQSLHVLRRPRAPRRR
jgi:HEAT repeat protein